MRASRYTAHYRTIQPASTRDFQRPRAVSCERLVHWAEFVDRGRGLSEVMVHSAQWQMRQKISWFRRFVLQFAKDRVDDRARGD